MFLFLVLWRDPLADPQVEVGQDLLRAHPRLLTAVPHVLHRPNHTRIITWHSCFYYTLCQYVSVSLYVKDGRNGILKHMRNIAVIYFRYVVLSTHFLNCHSKNDFDLGDNLVELYYVKPFDFFPFIKKSSYKACLIFFCMSLRFILDFLTPWDPVGPLWSNFCSQIWSAPYKNRVKRVRGVHSWRISLKNIQK